MKNIEQEFLKIDNIPALLWGEKSNKIIIAVHGMMSHKADISIEILAKISIKYGYQVLSFDLAKHGDRKEDLTPLTPQICIEELNKIYSKLQESWEKIYLFANSIGAYFSLLAYKDSLLEKAFFLSPLLDMGEVIENMMKAFGITQERLREEKEIDTPIGEKLSLGLLLLCKRKSHSEVATIYLYIVWGER